MRVYGFSLGKKATPSLKPHKDLATPFRTYVKRPVSFTSFSSLKPLPGSASGLGLKMINLRSSSRRMSSIAEARLANNFCHRNPSRERSFFSNRGLTLTNGRIEPIKPSLAWGQLNVRRPHFVPRSTIKGLSSRHDSMEDDFYEESLAVHVDPFSELFPTKLLKIVKTPPKNVITSAPSLGVEATDISPAAADPLKLTKKSMSIQAEVSMSSATITDDGEPNPITNTVYNVFREMAPYIAVHYNSVVVLHIPGEVLESEEVDQVMHDIVLLKTLGMKLVIVAGCRPQIRKHLDAIGIRSMFVHGNRVCDLETLRHCQSVAGSVRFEIESKLGRGLMNAPVATSVQVLSGNFVKAIPYGVRGGIDYKYSGLVQRVKAKHIHSLLDQGNIVLLGHLGYSNSAQVFHCRSEEVAVTAAADLGADKLIFFHSGESLIDEKHNRVVHNLSLRAAQSFTDSLREELGQTDTRIRHTSDHPLLEWKVQFLDYLLGAVTAVKNGVERVHLVSRHSPGALITEMCTREGAGLMISYEVYDAIRKATSKDIPALLSLVQPLEKQGILVTRPPSLLELEADRFYVFERDGSVLACFQYKNYKDNRYENGVSEMSCVAVNPEIQRDGIGTALLSYFMRKCLLDGVHHAFVLTTQSSHWFMEHGFEERPPEDLPPSKYAQYDFTRNPKVYYKVIENEKQIDQEEILWMQKRK